MKLYLVEILKEYKKFVLDWFVNGILLFKELRGVFFFENFILIGFDYQISCNRGLFFYIMQFFVFFFLLWDYNDVCCVSRVLLILKMYSEYVG